MDSLLGYRPPQLSEELAWLPCWFQQQHAQTLDDEKDIDSDFKNKCTREDVIISLDDEGRYKSCHLFLSGEDMPSASLCPSSANVEGLRLHLSSDDTQDLYSSGLSTIKVGNTSLNYVALVQKTDLPSSQELKANECPMDNDARETSAPPLTSHHETLEHPCLQSLERNNDMMTKNQDNIRKPNASEISKAVELSIAAAEALIICDMVKSSSSTKCLSTGAILEVALRVKQARLECPENSSYSSEEDIDIIESMSDSHESDMEDAFQDVGLIVCGSMDLVASAADISQVKETPNSETCSLNVSPVDTFSEQEPKNIVDMDNQERKNLSDQLLDFDEKRKLKFNQTSDLASPSKTSHDDIGLRLSVVEKSNFPAASEELHLPLENMTLPLKKTKDICSPQVDGSVNEERDDKHLYGCGKFQSRWLGGWMWKKETNASTTITCKSRNLIPKLMIGETSYLSESADVAPDKNSYVQIQDEGSHMASQPSILFRGLHDGADEGVQFSPDTAVSSCSSLADAICSVVPCSLSPAYACSPKVHDSNYVEDTEERLASDHCNDNLQRNSILNAEFVYGEQQTILKLNDKVSHSTVRRQLTSLRTYSTLLPECGLFLENDRNSQRLTSQNNSIFLSTEKNLYVRGIEENHETSNKIRQDESETWVHVEKDRSSSLILNHGKRHCVSACKKVDLDSDRGQTSEKALISMFDVAHPNSNLQKDQLKCGAANDPEIPARKRVRFSEACTRPLQKTNAYKQFSLRECLAARAGKKIKSSDGQRVKKPQSNVYRKNAKRLIFRNLEFLLTGFPGQKEREINKLIRNHGGTVLPGVPSPNSRGRRSSRMLVQQYPVVLCPHELETTEFLYGCVVNAFILKVDWLSDSVKAGSALAPDKYMVISNHGGERRVGKPFCRKKHNCIFDGVGVMLHGNHSFCTRLATVIKHGGGKVYKTLQLMVQNLDAKKITSGIIIAEDERNVSRHLKRCASEGKIHTMTASWIIKSLHVGKLLPFSANIHSSCLPKIKILDFVDSSDFSQEL